MYLMRIMLLLLGNYFKIDEIEVVQLQILVLTII